MWMHAAFGIALALAAPGASPETLPPGEFTARVTTVIGGDALRVTTGDGDALVALYGVSCLKRAPEAAAAAGDFLRAQTREIEVTVVPIKVLAGMPYVEIILPGGEVVNHLLLAGGLADLDLLTAKDDPAYAAIPAASPHAVEEDAAEFSAPPAITPASIEAYKIRRHLRETASFEAGLEKWQAMPAEYRQAVRRQYEEQLMAAGANGAEVLSALRHQVDHRAAALDAAQQRAAERQEAIAAETAEEGTRRQIIFNDPSLQWNARMLNTYRADYLADLAEGNESAVRVRRRLINRYSYRTAADLERVHAAAEAVTAEAEARRQAHRNALRGLSAEQRAIADGIRESSSRLRFAGINTSNAVGRLSAALVRLDLYDEALAAEMVPTLALQEVTVLQGDTGEIYAPFPITTPVWRVDWYAEALRPGSHFAGNIHDARDGRLIARFRSTSPPHESFLLLDGPGEFTLTTEVFGAVRYAIEVLAVDAL